MDVDILPCSRRLRAYGGNELPVCGMFNTAFQLNQTTMEDEVIVIRGPGEFLLGKSTAVALNALVLPEVNTVRSSAEQLQEKIPTVFHGVGKLKGYQATLHVDVEIQPWDSANVGFRMPTCTGCRQEAGGTPVHRCHRRDRWSNTLGQSSGYRSQEEW